MSQANDQELQSFFGVVWERRKITFSVTGIVILCGIAYQLFAPSVWEAKATIVFPVRTPSLLGAGSFDQASLTATLTGGATPLKVFSGMIDSERALDYVAKKTGVERKKIKDMRFIQEAAMESSITVSARNTDADLAKSVVALHLEALKEINEKISKPLVSNDSVVIKVQLDAQRRKLAQSEQTLLTFQQQAVTAPTVIATGSGKDSSLVPSAGRWAESLKQLEIQYTSLDSTIKDAEARVGEISGDRTNLPASLPPVEKWRSRLTDLQYELKVRSLTLANEAPEIVKLKKTIKLTEDALHSEMSKYSTAVSSGMINPEPLTRRVALEAQISAVKKLAKLAPGESIRLTQLTRDVTTQSMILQQLQAQYQLAELQSDRDPNRWEILDEPRVDEKAVNKSYSKNGFLSLIAGLALGAVAAMLAPRRKVLAGDDRSEASVGKGS